MKIVGGRIVGVDAKKLEGSTFTGFDVNIGITDVKEVGKTIEVHYEHVAKYMKDFAEMSVRGVIIAEADDKERKKVVEDFKKTKQLPIENAEEMLMAINYATSTIGTLLAFAIGVSAPINIQRPRIMPAMPGQPASKAG